MFLVAQNGCTAPNIVVLVWDQSSQRRCLNSTAGYFWSHINFLSIRKSISTDKTQWNSKKDDLVCKSKKSLIFWNTCHCSKTNFEKYTPQMRALLCLGLHKSTVTLPGLSSITRNRKPAFDLLRKWQHLSYSKIWLNCLHCVMSTRAC